MRAVPRSRLVLVLLVALPGVVLGTAGIFHPATLTLDDAERWRDIHIVALPLFPLLAIGPWLLARQAHPVAGWVALLLGYTYATFYTGLDLLAGAAAGALKLVGSDNLGTVFALASGLADVGVWAYLSAAVLAAGVVIRQVGARALPGAVVVVGASVSFLDSHIYWPRGVLTMYALALGWGALAAVLPAHQPAAPAARGTQAAAASAPGPDPR